MGNAQFPAVMGCKGQLFCPVVLSIVEGDSQGYRLRLVVQ